MFPINAISVDPSFFEQIESLEELHSYKSDRESMCYLLIYLDRKEGYCYCVSQGQRININKKDIKTAEIDSALQFVTTTEKSRDGVLCSDCLYKYLRTLGEASEGFLTDYEKQEVISSYMKEVASRLAAELSGFSEGKNSEHYQHYVKQYIKRLNRTRSQWAALTMKIKDSGSDQTLMRLVEYYRTLYRLESIFLTQVLALDENQEESDPLHTLQFMVGVSEKVIRLSDQIRESTHEILNRKVMSLDIQESLKKHSEKRRKTEFKFINLIKVLSEIDAHTSQ
ncbi:hypothetical protein EU527_14090 [Candidatus Thorarchaeota archaeon]|nr:MAG: hypothetical protein EU527_14090 [Candidatus Thorarchaeota archaeon]